jgi:Peptidase family C25/Propeptide_C25
MMKKIIGIFVCILMICGTFVSAHNMTSNNKSINVEDGALTVQIPVDDYKIEKVNQNDEVTIQGYGRLLIPGQPNLPSKIFSIAIPPGATVRDVQFETKNGVVLTDVYQIAPCILPRVIGAENPVLYERDQQKYEENYQSIYGNNNPYPASVGEVIGTGGYRKYNLVDVRITPFVYYPLSGRLMYYPDITVTVQYTIPKGFSPEDIMIDTLPQTEHTAKEIILNYDQAKNWYKNGPVGREQYDYVIITLDSLTSSVTSLVNWETAKGRSVYVATTEWINSNYEGYDLAAKMRAFLREKYPASAWGILDVCLIGHWNDVPMRLTAQEPKTDYYYAELSLPDYQSWDIDNDHQYGEDSDPIDFEAEINVGRIPWSDPETVQSICNKSIAYEQNNDDSFKKNILLLGAYFWADTDNAVLMEAKVDQEWMTGWTMTRMYEDAQSSHPCDYDLTYNNVETIWSMGTYAFVDWAGHGSENAAYEYYPSQPFVDETTCTHLNDQYPSIVFADSCSNSDTDYLNIGQAMLKQGAIGFLGSNKIAYGQPGWNDPMDGSSQSLDYFFTTCCTSGNYTQGQAHQWSLREMYTHNLWTAGTYYETFEWGSLFGNPDLTMGPVITSDSPAQPTRPIGKTLAVWNKEYSYSSITTDPNGDQIFYLFNWGDGSNSGWLGPYSSGQTGTGTHMWTKLGTYNVTVKARDINGAGSIFSDPLTVVVTDNTPPDTPTITGETNIKPHISYTYILNGTDDQDQDLLFDIDWGDGNGATGLGPYHSGETVTMMHTWKTRGTYTIKTRTTDTVGAKSEWATIQLVTPTQYQFSLNVFLQHLIERFPHMFTVLRYLIGY